MSVSHDMMASLIMDSVSHADLDELISALDVKFVQLSECLVSGGHRLEMADLGALETALAELSTQQIGAGAMSGALLKQVIVQLVRRSLGSSALWAKRFTLLRDPQVARAFGVMAASPGSAHTVQSLAKAASLGRSAFMSRFTEIVGQSPMTVLRDLRMRQAALYLETTDLAVDQVADSVGYASRSSFVRAFRRAYEVEPSEYRSRCAQGTKELPGRGRISLSSHSSGMSPM